MTQSLAKSLFFPIEKRKESQQLLSRRTREREREKRTKRHLLHLPRDITLHRQDELNRQVQEDQDEGEVEEELKVTNNRSRKSARFVRPDFGTRGFVEKACVPKEDVRDLPMGDRPTWKMKVKVLSAGSIVVAVVVRPLKSRGGGVVS